MTDIAQIILEGKAETSAIGASHSARRDISRLIRHGFVNWTATEAAYVLHETRYPHQDRDLKVEGERHKKVLADLMRRGKWREFDKLDFACLPDGTLILINGHHRLGAQEAAGCPIWWTVVIHDCVTIEEASNLYYSFDTNTRIRTSEQIISATGLRNELGLSRTLTTAVMNAVPLIAANMDPNPKVRDTIVNRVFDIRFDFARQYKEAAQAFEACIKNADTTLKKRLFTQGATAVALVTLRFQPESAISFWVGIGDNDGLLKGDPRHTYIRTVVGHSARSNTAWTTGSIAAAAWNAWCRKETPSRFNPGDMRPLKIIGTPFEKGR